MLSWPGSLPSAFSLTDLAAMWTSLATVAMSREISTALAAPPIKTTTCPKKKGKTKSDHMEMKANS